MKTVKLNNGIEMPVLGLGTFLSNDPAVCEQSVVDAISLGYRLIDTAQGYGNEEHIGRAIARCGVPREELFITTKVWFRNYGNTRVSVEESMRKLQTDYLDLVLLHWPFGDTYAAWRVLVAPPKKVHKCFSHMKTLELEIVQGFFFYPHYAFRYIFVKLDFANSVAFFKAFEKAINMHHTSLFFSCLTIPISGVKK